MAKHITTLDGFRAAIAEVVDKTDFNLIGQVKDHMKETVEGDPSSKVPTGESFLTVQTRMPQGSAIHIDGQDFYPNTLQIKLDAFKLKLEPGEKSASAPRAATANAVALRQRLAGKGPTHVVAVPAAEVPAS